MLHPGTCGEPLRARLDTISLPEEESRGASADDYEAISYAWESPRLSKSILTAEGIIQIPRSLHEALQHLRYRDRTRRLWADAPCISQTDNKERASQVATMGLIFGTALKVLVWLGPSEPSYALAFATLAYEEHLADQFTTDDPLPFLDHVLRESPYCACCREPFAVRKHLGLAGLLAAKQLLHRAWFNRVWTVQEVTGPSSRIEIHSGVHTGSLQSLKNAFHRLHDVQRLTDYRYVTEGAFDRIAELHEVAEAHQASLTMTRSVEDVASVLMTIARRGCSDPRDRLFALRGILGIREESGLMPNYSLPSAEVYHRYISYIFQITST